VITLKLWSVSPQHYCLVADRNDPEIHSAIPQNRRKCLLLQKPGEVPNGILKAERRRKGKVKRLITKKKGWQLLMLQRRNRFR
jgi:hypothetical protein